jgi:flagellar M-ring protein FliF
MRPQHVTAVVNVPASHYLRIWKQLNPTTVGQPAKEPDAAELKKIEGEEIKRIEDTVANLLPPQPAGKSVYPLVKVTTYVDTPATPPAPVPLTTGVAEWLSANWRTVGMLLVGLVGLFMLRGMLRNKPASLADGRDTSAAVDDQRERGTEPEQESSPEPVLVMRRKLSSKGPNLREELRQLVKDDPDAAANVLRGWIGEAA